MFFKMTTTVVVIRAWTVLSVVHLVVDSRAIHVHSTSQVPAASSVGVLVYSQIWDPIVSLRVQWSLSSVEMSLCTRYHSTEYIRIIANDISHTLLVTRLFN